MAGYPLPTAEMEFRRLERQKLLPASQILLTMEERRGEDDPYTVVVGTWEEQVTVGYLFHRRSAADRERAARRAGGFRPDRGRARG